MEALNVQALVKDMEKRYKLILNPDDPILMAVAMNQILLEKYDNAIRELFSGFGEQLESHMATINSGAANVIAEIHSGLESVKSTLIPQSERAAQRVFSAAFDQGKDEIVKAVDFAWEQGRGVEEIIHDQVRRERWISVASMILCVVFAILTFWMMMRTK